MKTEIIACVNQKGGVGKSTTCINLGVGLAQEGRKVLLLDADAQASMTIGLGYPQPDQLPTTLSDVMGKVLTDEPISFREGILHHPEGIDLMPADIQLAGMEVSLVNAMSRETILRQYLDTLRGQYSHILLDCQPSLGMMTIKRLGGGQPPGYPGAGRVSSGQGLGAALKDRGQGQAEHQPPAADRGDFADHGGQPHELCQGDQPADPGHLRREDPGL